MFNRDPVDGKRFEAQGLMERGGMLAGQACGREGESEGGRANRWAAPVSIDEREQGPATRASFMGGSTH